MGWPQIIYIGLVTLGLGYSLAKDGQPKTGRHDFVGHGVVASLIIGLLYWGGFFS